MYWLMSIDALIRIAFAMAFLFVIVPALAWPRRKGATFLEGFFWNFGVGIMLITLVGQVFTLASLFSLVTLLLVAGLVVLFGRSVYLEQSPWTVVRRSFETTFLAFLNILDRRVNVPRRIRRRFRRTIAALHQKTQPRQVRMQIAGWAALTTVAAGFRLYRPLASANLGFSDTYVHLYFLKLLEEGRQVDPQFGPYPRGMHFVLMAIHHLTNVDLILLMNFFGAFVGVLMTLAVADTARRLSGNVGAGLLAGFLFATVVGGPRQSFLLGPFDMVLDGFQRQTTTLPQELALVLLFPAVMFLLDYLRGHDRWYLMGFAGCTAAIAAVHSGVVIPLLMMAVLAVLAMAIHRGLTAWTVRRAVIGGVLGMIVGSAWALGFVAYPYFGGKSEASGGFASRVIATAYTPFIDSLFSHEATGASATRRLMTPLTPFLVVCILLAIALVTASFISRDELRVNRLWIASVFLIFLLVHFAPILGVPQLLETGRNSQWMMMSLVIMTGVAIVGIVPFARSISMTKGLTATHAAVALLLLLIIWTSRVPHLTDPVIHDRLVNYSGYGASTLAVLKIQQSLEPYTWTLVSYGQEFPMVLRRGFHLPATQFLDSYDPTLDVIPIPTPHIFIIVEKTPHPFQIENWARRFSRSNLEERLQTWVYLYQATHRNLRVFLEDEHVRVYQIERTAGEMEAMSRRPRV